LNLLIDAVESDRYPMSPRVRALKDILMKFGEVDGLPPELAHRPAPKVYELPGRGRYKRR
jgi:hypothetical protein